MATRTKKMMETPAPPPTEPTEPAPEGGDDDGDDGDSDDEPAPQTKYTGGSIPRN